MNEKLIKKRASEELEVKTKAILSFWDKDNKAVEVYFAESNRLITALANKHKGFNALKKSWGSDRKQEFGGIANEITTEYCSICREWLKTPKKDAFPDIVYFAKQKIGQLLKTEKERLENEDPYTGIKYERYNKKINNPIELIPLPSEENKKIKTNILRNAGTYLPTISSKEKKVNDFAKEIRDGFKPLPYIIKQREKNRGKVSGDVLKDRVRAPLKGIIEKLLLAQSEAKSIYLIAKEKEIAFRKLLYTLKTIQFPMGKNPNLIYKHYLPLFEEIFPQIQRMWKLENNFKGWITYFNKEKWWEKSRISKFMKRRIADKTVPIYFFDVFPAHLLSSAGFVKNLINGENKLMELFKILSALFKVDFTESDTHGGIKNRLTDYCIRCSKTLLSEATE
jgi:hypothetical protein